MHGVKNMKRNNTIDEKAYLNQLHDLNISPEQQIEDVKKELKYLIENFEDAAFYKFMLALVEELDDLDDFRICDKIVYIESELWLQLLKLSKRKTGDLIIERGLVDWVYREIDIVWLRLIEFEDYRGAKDERQDRNSEN